MNKSVVKKVIPRSSAFVKTTPIITPKMAKMIHNIETAKKKKTPSVVGTGKGQAVSYIVGGGLSTTAVAVGKVATKGKTLGSAIVDTDTITQKVVKAGNEIDSGAHKVIGEGLGKVGRKIGKAGKKIGSVLDSGTPIKVGDVFSSESVAGKVAKWGVESAGKVGEGAGYILKPLGKVLDFIEPFGQLALLGYYGYSAFKSTEAEEKQQIQYLNELVKEGYIDADKKESYDKTLKSIATGDGIMRFAGDIANLGGLLPYWKHPEEEAKNSALTNLIMNAGVINYTGNTYFKNPSSVAEYPIDWKAILDENKSIVREIKKLGLKAPPPFIFLPNMSGTGIKVRKNPFEKGVVQYTPKEYYLIMKYIEAIGLYNKLYGSMLEQNFLRRKARKDFEYREKEFGMEVVKFRTPTEVLHLSRLNKGLTRMIWLYSIWFFIPTRKFDEKLVRAVFPKENFPKIYSFLPDYFENVVPNGDITKLSFRNKIAELSGEIEEFLKMINNISVSKYMLFDRTAKTIILNYAYNNEMEIENDYKVSVPVLTTRTLYPRKEFWRSHKLPTTITRIAFMIMTLKSKNVLKELRSGKSSGDPKSIFVRN